MRSNSQRLALAALALLALALAACGSADDQDNGAPGSQSEPTSTAQPQAAVTVGHVGSAAHGQETFQWPPDGVAVSREEAIERVGPYCRDAGPQRAPLDELASPVARLMPAGEHLTGFQDRELDPDDYIWVAQFEAKYSEPAPPGGQGPGEPGRFAFWGGHVDAASGEPGGCFFAQRPQIMPQPFLGGLPDGSEERGFGYFQAASGQTEVSREQAMEKALEAYGDGPRSRYLSDGMEAELVRYTRTKNKPKVDGQLAWLVIVPQRLELMSYSNPEGDPVYYWQGASYTFVDAETGETYGDGGLGMSGPNMSQEESMALRRFAWDEGWWALWHRVKQYNGEPLPDGMAAELDRPDAPTPTPYPPTPTPDPNAPPPPTPTPTPPPPATPTPGHGVAPTPNPTPLTMTAMCEETQGASVEIAGEEISLPEGFCVWRMDDDSGIARIWIVGERSYVDVDTDTGEMIGGRFYGLDPTGVFDRFVDRAGRRRDAGHGSNPTAAPTSASGIAATPTRLPTATPAPPTARCEETQGASVEIAGEEVPLNPSLCVSQWDGHVARIQVAGGRSYVGIDTRTGEQVDGSLHWEESHLFEHLEAILGEELPPGPPTPTSTPFSPDDDGTRHDFESSEEAHEFVEEEAARSSVRSSSGPSTRGGTVRIGDRSVDLPEDAYISKRWHAGMCEDPDNCPPFPWVEITRGDSTVLIGADGAVVEKDIAPGDEATFDFIWEALGTPPYPTPVPAGG